MHWLKAKMLAGLLAGLFASLQPAKAQVGPLDEVILAHDGAETPRPELLLALRIQLTGVANARTHSLTLPSSTPSRIDAVSAVARAENALLAVWVEGPVRGADGSGEAVLYAVGQNRERALLEVIRVSGGAGPDLDRTLALKVREIVDQLREARSAGATQQLELVLSAPPPEPTWQAGAALGAVASPLQGSEAGQWGAYAAAGPLLGSATWRLAGGAELMFMPRVDIHRGDARVGIQELAPGLWLRAQSKQGPLWLGLRTGFALSFIAVDGRANADAPTDEASVRVASCRIGADAELPLAAGVGLLLGVDLQMRWQRRHFAVDREEAADLGIVRPLFSLALTWNAGDPAP